MSLFNRPDINKGAAAAKETEGAILLDVRTPDEYRSGHIPGSINVPLNRVDSEDFDPDAKIYVYCHSGARAGRACDILSANGYDAENIGGITKYKGALE